MPTVGLGVLLPECRRLFSRNQHRLLGIAQAQLKHGQAQLRPAHPVHASSEEIANFYRGALNGTPS